MIDEVDHKIRTNKWYYHIWNFIKEHIIQPYNLNKSNKPEEERYISCMTPSILINGQYESR